MREVGSDFKQFVLRGNVVDLAVAVVVGTAFGAVVTALVKDLLTPVIGLIFGTHDFSALSFAINGSVFRYGDFLNSLVAFMSIATVVFFFVVQPVNLLMRRRRTEPDLDSETHACTECLSDIPLLAHKCAFCGSSQTPASQAPRSAT
jgi:large conductance mechanosensitive channel